MQFNSYIFIMLFLPISVSGWHLLNRRSCLAAKLWLIGLSLVFYARPFKELSLFLAISLVVNFLASRAIASGVKFRRGVFVLALAFNVLSLLFYKYRVPILRFFDLPFGDTAAAALPAGISFFTFQQLAYIILVYREPEKLASPVDYLLYVLSFPKLIMGPLAEPSELIPQFNRAGDSFDRDNLASGIKLFGAGLIKKVFLADTFAGAFAWTLSNSDVLSSADALVGTLSYTFRIYFDFSGYSDMAIGIALMFNIALPMNFDSPYKAVSISDFWKRWHMTLTSFLTKYVYIPLGGNRKGTVRTYLNIMLVFLISGIWHGSGYTFLLWGALHGLLSIFDRIAEKPMSHVPKPLRRALTFTAVSLLWLLFASESVEQWLQIMGRLFSFDSAAVNPALSACFKVAETAFISDILYVLSYTDVNPILWTVLFLLMAFVICLVPENACRRRDILTPASAFAAAVALVWGILNLAGETVYVYSVF